MKLNLNGLKNLGRTVQELGQCIASTFVKLTGTKFCRKPKLIVHKNQWYWGTSYTTVTSDGYGVHNMGIEKKHPKECFFGSIVVHKSKRNKGIGKMLHLAGEQLAVQLGMCSIELVTDKDSWMQKWYERMNYKVVKYNDNGTVTMKKYL